MIKFTERLLLCPCTYAFLEMFAQERQEYFTYINFYIKGIGGANQIMFL